MQFLKVEINHLQFSIAEPDDAQKVVLLYQKVYGSDYPCPELFTVEGMKEFLDFNQSNAATMIILYCNEVIAAATCQLNGRAVYSRGFMVDPIWQGKINAKRAFQHILLLFRKFFNKQADLFYGEARTETPKIQAIIEEIDWKPMVILPRKDIFHGKRETEIIYVWYYQQPQPRPLSLTFQASQIAAKVLHRSIDFVEKQNEFKYNSPVDIYTVEKVESNGDSHIVIRLPSGAELSALICYKSANSEKVRIRANSTQEFYSLVSAYIKEIRARKIDYAEIYVDACEYFKQMALEGLGFKPTGFLPQWYAPGESDPHDYVVYTRHWQSILPDCPIQCTEQGAFLKNFVDQPTPDEIIPKLDGLIERIPTINDLS